MFSLVKCDCASCFEERDCVYCIHCANAKTFYCKDCIIDYNKVHGSVGICPTCKAHYGKQNCYYIYGTDIVPVLNDQMDKYRERILSNDTYQLAQTCKRFNREYMNDISCKRSLLLQLYLTSLYVEDHPSETRYRQTWVTSPDRAEVIITMFNVFEYAWRNFEMKYLFNSLTQSIKRINKEYNNIKWCYKDQNKKSTKIRRRKLSMTKEEESTIYLRKFRAGLHELEISPGTYTYLNLYPHGVEIKLTVNSIDLTNERLGIAKAAVVTNQSITIDGISYVLREAKPTVYKDFDLSMFDCIDHSIDDRRRNPIPISSKERESFEEDDDDSFYGLYEAYQLSYTIRELKILPDVSKIDDLLFTDKYINAVRYYNAISATIIDHLNQYIKNDKYEVKGTDDRIHSLMQVALRVKAYTDRMINPTPSDQRMKNHIIDMLLHIVRSDVFDVCAFLTQLDAYYMYAPIETFSQDLQPVIDVITKQIFDEKVDVSSFVREVRGKLRLMESPPKYAMLPDTFELGLANILKQKNNQYKLSFVRCVCGGSVIAKDIEGKTTVYECTRCHKQLESLPEQETDPETLKLLESISKRCPVCGTYIEKVEGCNHMFCTNCKNGFNWNDLSKLDDRDNTNPHFHEHRHGSASNLRTLLDDYDRPARKDDEPIDWFGHELFTDMNKAEKKLKEHRESIEKCYTEFIDDDRFALKFVNELNVHKMRIAFIQNTFDKMMVKAFETIQRDQRGRDLDDSDDEEVPRGRNNRTIRREHSQLVNTLSSEYTEGKNMIGAILDALNLSIDCSVNITINLSRGIEEESFDIPQEMEDEAKAMEQEILKQITERAQSMQPAESTMVINDRRVTIRRG